MAIDSSTSCQILWALRSRTITLMYIARDTSPPHDGASELNEYEADLFTAAHFMITSVQSFLIDRRWDLDKSAHLVRHVTQIPDHHIITWFHIASAGRQLGVDDQEYARLTDGASELNGAEAVLHFCSLQCRVFRPKMGPLQHLDKMLLI